MDIIVFSELHGQKVETHTEESQNLNAAGRIYLDRNMESGRLVGWDYIRCEKETDVIFSVWKKGTHSIRLRKKYISKTKHYENQENHIMVHTLLIIQYFNWHYHFNLSCLENKFIPIRLTVVFKQ